MSHPHERETTDPPGEAYPSDGRVGHRHGRWSLRVAGDELSEIALDGVVLVETLRPALRDRNWGTIPPRIRAEAWERRGQDLVRTLEVDHGTEGGTVRATDVLVIGPDELRLRYEMRPGIDVETNRVGLTVMLPRLMAGEDVVVRTPAGERRDARLPVQVAPFQPLFDIRELDLDHRGVRANLQLLGDVFEMEDQRNWCDASYKIYSRPLAAPFPYRVPAGESVVQEVRLRAVTAAGERAPVRGADGARDLAALLERAPAVRIPRIAVGATTSFADASEAAAPALGGLESLVVEVADGFPLRRILASAAFEARAAGLGIDLRIAGDEGTDVASILTEAREAGLAVRRAALLEATRHVSTDPLLARLAAATDGTDTELVAGARTHFTELNREIRAIPEGAHLLAFAHTPEMHMQETWHVVESLATLPDVLASARALRPGARLSLGPATLRPRINAVATEPGMIDRADEHGYGAHLTPGGTDPRQHTEWAGAWAACLIAAAAAGEVEHVVLGELSGPRGLVGPDGEPSPMGLVVRELAGIDGEVRVLTDVAGSGTALIAAEDLLIAANAREEPWELLAPASGAVPARRVRIPGGTVRRIGATGALPLASCGPEPGR